MLTHRWHALFDIENPLRLVNLKAKRLADDARLRLTVSWTLERE